jgi:Mor family transcriptional regulator
VAIEKTAMRNREMFAAYQTGESIQDLAMQYGISGHTVRQIIMIERHKIAVSVGDFYQEMRARKRRPQS